MPNLDLCYKKKPTKQNENHKQRKKPHKKPKNQNKNNPTKTKNKQKIPQISLRKQPFFNINFSKLGNKRKRL